RTFWARAFGESLGDGQHAGGPRTVVVRAVEDAITGADLFHADVVVVRADGDVFVFEYRVAAIEHGHDILRRGGLCVNRNSEARVLRRAEFECVGVFCRSGGLEDRLTV